MGNITGAAKEERPLPTVKKEDCAKEKEEQKDKVDKYAIPRREDLFSAEEKEALRSNRFVILPCYTNPFAGFGKRNEDTVSGLNEHNTSKGESKWDRIVSHLSRPISDSGSLTALLKELSGIETSYFVERFKDTSSEGYQEFFKPEGTLAKMQSLVLKMPSLFPEHSIPLLIPKVDQEVTLTREQIACLLAGTFFGVIEEPSKYSLYSYSSFGFDVLYASNWGTVLTTLECILHYFNRVCHEMPSGRITFHRQVMSVDKIPQWASSKKRIVTIKTFDEGIIEDSIDAVLQVDFANASIGGGVSRGGSAQEEIMFATKTECIIPQLFCAQLEDDEVLFIRGAEKFSAYKGYGRSFTWAGDYVDKTPRDEEGNIKNSIVAMDAVRTFGGQFDIDLFHRDINKAFNAFSFPSKGAIATGNWGCGVFGGDKSVKFFQQLLAASEAGQEELCYYTFNEDYYEPSHKLSAWIGEVMQIIEENSLTVGQVYEVVLEGLRDKSFVEETGNMFEWFKRTAQNHNF